MGRYREKPIVIEAVQLRWDTWSEMCEHAGVGKLKDGKPEGTMKNDATGEPFEVDGPGLAIPTLKGVMIGCPMDWIIKGVQSEIYPCKPDIFEATYELVEESDD